MGTAPASVANECGDVVKGVGWEPALVWRQHRPCSEHSQSFRVGRTAIGSTLWANGSHAS